MPRRNAWMQPPLGPGRRLHGANAITRRVTDSLGSSRQRDVSLLRRRSRLGHSLYTLPSLKMITPPEPRLRAFPTSRELALPQNRRGRALRALHRAVRNFALPSPRFVSRPALWLVLAVRATYSWSIPVLIGEPLFKAHCKSYGRD